LAHQAVSQHQQQQQTPQQILPQPFQQQQQQFQQQQQQGQQHLFSQLQQQLQQLQQQLDLQSQLPLAPPPMAPPQQPYPAWTAGTAASAAHLSGASPAPSATGSVTPFPSSGFVGMVSQAGTPAPSMYSAAINENNGVAESRVREITKIARCLLVHASCPPSLWGYALLHATLLTNLYPHPILPSTTPTELWTSAKPDVSSLRVWGSRAYVLIHPADRPRTMGKLASRTLPCIFLGHNPSSPDYLFLHPPSVLGAPPPVILSSSPLPPLSPLMDLLFQTVLQQNTSPTLPSSSSTAAPPAAATAAAAVPPTAAAPAAAAVAPSSPSPAAAAVAAADAAVAAASAAAAADASSAAAAAAAAASAAARYAVDFFDTFSPTAKPATIRAVLDLAARLNMEIHSMDVSNAFLQGVLRELIYMERPAGFHLPFPSDSVWQLRRPVYGLKQAPREWHAKLAATLAELGFSTSRADPSLFLRTSPSPFYILVYVDDMILITADSAELERVKRELGSRLKCKDLGELQHYLGMEITRDRAARTISLSQGHYLQQVLERFDMARGTPQVTPLPVGHHLTPLTSPSSSSHPYAELIGSLMLRTPKGKRAGRRVPSIGTRSGTLGGRRRVAPRPEVRRGQRRATLPESGRRTWSRRRKRRRRRRRRRLQRAIAIAATSLSRGPRGDPHGNAVTARVGRRRRSRGRRRMRRSRARRMRSRQRGTRRMRLSSRRTRRRRGGVGRGRHMDGGGHGGEGLGGVGLGGED
ncbi:hypothetical protein CLOP_g2159, partial [Closterium sp. NIES-67]